MRWIALSLLALLLVAAPAGAQAPIRQSRGVDPGVDYRSLTRYGPWDDRNYQLTAEDLALLPEWESQLDEPLPAFFRVLMRRSQPELARRRLPYPRSALNVFLQQYGGYLVEGRLYRGVERVGGELRVILDGGVPAPPAGESAVTRALDGEARVTSPVGAAESAVAISPADPALVIAGTNGPLGGQRMHYSSDGGETWALAANQGALPLGSTCCDPTVDWSADGSFAYAATLGYGAGIEVWFYRSSDSGQTWDDLESVTPGDPRRELSTASSDKEYLHVDRHAGSPYQDNVYATWHEGNVMKFARSTNFGNTWSMPLQVSAADELGIGSDIVTDASGNVYYVWPTYGTEFNPAESDARILVARSTDGGATFGAATQIAPTLGEYEFPIPSMDARKVFIYVAAAVDLSPTAAAVRNGASDRLYVAWTDSTGPTGALPANNHARIQVAWSDDGAAWTVTTPHETDDLATVDRWHPWIAVGADGVVHVSFYDTRNDPTRESVDLYYTRSLDRGVTWSPPQRLTSVSSPDLSDSFEFGDYNGLDALMGCMVAVFTDNRNEEGGGGDSKDVYAAGLVTCAAAPNVDLTSDPPVSSQVTEIACETIIAGGTYFVQAPGGDLTLDAGESVTLTDGFLVEEGAVLQIGVNPCFLGAS